MNISYLLYQAERTRSTAEQREADVRAGEFAAAIARAGRAGRRAVTRRRGTGHHEAGRQGTGRAGRRMTPAAVLCAILGGQRPLGGEPGGDR
jgi:hypothetical protein